jgi:arabinofuranan 3-O-arabinosyltransferase
MTNAVREVRLRLAAALLVVWAAAWSVPAGRVSEDTKNDLYVDAWGFLARAAHLWDAQVTWGVLQNQGYGYLFPMGPFFGLASEVVPVWVAQRLWWGGILTVGLLTAHALIRAVGVGGPTAGVLGALAYALSPRVVSTVGGLSSEALPTLLAPAILLPVVLASRGRLGPRRAAALSALAVLGCGGVNATATVLAAVPTGLWLVTRRRWWRAPLTGWWAAGTVVASVWWLGPLVVLGRWSPPFLGWIERTADVVRRIDLLDVVRGTTHWLGYVVTAGGEWWPAGYALATGPLLVVSTSLVAGVALAGLGLRGMPERRFLLVTLGLGVALIAVPHLGPVSSPFAPFAQALLDGPLVAFRNIHKADPLVRLPLAVGLAHALDRTLPALAARRLAVRMTAAAAGLAVGLLVVAPALSGAIAPRGTFRDMARQWREAGSWLSDRAGDGRALVVPASSFGEYDWGRTIDEPIRPLSSVPYAVRDAVPLTPAGTIRVLDAVEQRLQTGRDVGGAVTLLRRLGVRYLVLRNDLDATGAGQPSVTYARSAVRSTPAVTFAKGFGATRTDASGERAFPVEVYDLGAAAPLAVTQPVSDAVAVSGGPEDLLAVADAGVDGLAVLDGDAVAGVEPGRRVVTDGYRARERWFGATRGRDTSSTLAADELEGTRDYRPWEDLSRHAVTAFGGGVAAVGASSSLATTFTLAGLRPADRPAAAVDGDRSTAWVTQFDDHPTLAVRLDTARRVSAAHVEVLTDADRHPGLGVPTRLELRVEGGAVRVDVPASGRVDVPLPAGTTDTLTVEVLETDEGAPGRALTGIVDIALDGIAPTESVVGPADRPGPADVVVLSGGLAGSDSCVQPEDAVVCYGDGGRDAEGGAVLSRRVTAAGGASFEASGTLDVSRWAADPPGLSAPGVEVEASSSRTRSLGARPEAVVDGDERTAWSPAPDDTSPTLTLRLAEPVDVEALDLSARRGWMARHRPFVRVRLDDHEQVVRASADGHLPVAGTGVRTVAVTLLPLVGADRTAPASLEIEDLTVFGAQLPRPEPRLTRPCGEGPVLTVDGTRTSTRVDGPRSALWGEDPLRWVACDPVTLASGTTHEVVLRGDETLRPASVVFTGSAAVRRGTTTPVDVAAESPTLLTGRVAAGPERLLALAMNANDGWQATLAGRHLTPVVVDGFRQGYVLPVGASGALEVRFAPDGPYRWALGLGLLLALLVPVALVVPDRTRRPLEEAGSDAVPSPVVVAALAIAGAVVVAGLWAGLAAAAAVTALRLRREEGEGLVAAVVVALVTGSGLLVALTGPAWPTRPWVEAAVTLAVTGAAVLAGAGPVVRPSAWRAARGRRGSATPGPG